MADRGVEHDLDVVRDALIVLAGHLPLFSTDRHERGRAEQHLALHEEALNALDRLADALNYPRPERRTRA